MLRPMQSIRRLMPIPALILVLVLRAPYGQAQETATDVAAPSAAPEVEILADEFDRGTPRRSLLGFLTAAQDRDFETAAEYLDLRNLPSRAKNIEGSKLAHGISIVIQKELAETLSLARIGARVLELLEAADAAE